MEKSELEQLGYKILDLAGIPKNYAVTYHKSKNSFEMDIRLVNDQNSERKIQRCFSNIMKKSSIADRLKLNVKVFPTSWGKSIRVCLVGYPRLGEQTEDLITVLRLEGLI